MSRSDRRNLIVSRFAVISSAALSASMPILAPVPHVTPIRVSPLLSAEQRERLARETAPFKAFRAAVQNMPLMLCCS